MSLTRDDILGFATRKTEKVDVAGYGTVYVREPDAGDFYWYAYESFGRTDRGDNGERLMGARLICACLCDEAGALLFTRDDVGRASALPSSFAKPIVDKARSLLPKDESADVLAKN